MNEKLKYLGWYQIAGGVSGFLITLWAILNEATIQSATVIILFTAIALYIFSIYCGSLLIKRDRETKIHWTRINQILQILHVSIFGFTYKFYSGIQLSFGVDLTNTFLIKFLYSLSSFKFAYSSQGEEIMVMINIIPILIIQYLTKVEQFTAGSKVEALNKELLAVNNV